MMMSGSGSFDFAQDMGPRMAAPVIDQGVVIGTLVAQLSIDEIDKIVTGGRRWRHEGFGATGEAYLVGPDQLVRSSPRMFFENREPYFEELKGGQTPPQAIEGIRRYGTPVLGQGQCRGLAAQDVAAAAIALLPKRQKCWLYQQAQGKAPWG
jgi:hypothetical protein